MTDNRLSIDNSKSYTTEANLIAGLKKCGLNDLFHIVVRNRAGRWTAIFGIHLSGLQKTGDITAAARKGFMTID